MKICNIKVTEDIQYVLEADPDQLDKIMKSQKTKKARGSSH